MLSKNSTRRGYCSCDSSEKELCSAGGGYETFGIAACVIGGESMFGGKGKITGAVLGGIIIGMITNGLTIMRVSSFWQKIVMGALTIASVALEKLV